MRGGINTQQLIPEGEFPWLIKKCKSAFYASICEVNGTVWARPVEVKTRFNVFTGEAVCGHQHGAAGLLTASM